MRRSVRWAWGSACAVVLAIAAAWRLADPAGMPQTGPLDAPAPEASAAPAKAPDAATPAAAEPAVPLPAAPPRISTDRDIAERQIPLPGTLEAVLAELVPRAERGDADAAYRIFIKINDCAGALEGSPFVTLHVGEAARAAEQAWMADTLAKLEDCRGLRADQIESRAAWLTRAADLGDPLAQLTYTISAKLIVGDASQMLADPQAVQDFKSKSMRFLTTLAGRGDVAAILQLSTIYHHGVMAPRDDVKAYAYRRLSLLLGSGGEAIAASLAASLTPEQRLQGERLALALHRRCCG